MKMSQAQIDEYQQNGFVVVKNLVSPENLALLRRKIEDRQQEILENKSRNANIIYEPGGGTALATKPVLRKLESLAPEDTFFRSIAATPEILDIVSALTGNDPSVYLYSDQVFLKPALCGSEKPLHQDNSYFKVTPHHSGITCWMALDDATVENGCLHYIPGTHKLGLINHRAIANTPHLTPESEKSFGPEVAAPIPAGACLFHHLLVLHSSKANTSPNARRAWALHYASANATQSVKPFDEMLRLR
jgi:ectoine hydroxylase-related dioxygenase (phytanoyl-CoA dioxygenase family)